MSIQQQEIKRRNIKPNKSTITIFNFKTKTKTKLITKESPLFKIATNKVSIYYFD
jgi:hypothetical protein